MRDLPEVEQKDEWRQWFYKYNKIFWKGWYWIWRRRSFCHS